MKIGKMGINVYFIAALAMIFAILGWSTAGILIIGYALVVEKDNWLTKQTIAAFSVQLIAGAVNVVLGGFNRTIDSFANSSNSYDYSLGGMLSLGSSSSLTVPSVLRNIISWTGNITSLVLLVFLIIGLSNVIAGRDAGIPVVGNIANWAFGIVRPKPVYQPQQQYQQPPQQQQYQQQSPQQPQQQYQQQSPQQPQPQQYQQQPFGNVPPTGNQAPPNNTNNQPPQ